MFKICVTRIPEVTRELTTAEAILLLMEAVMGAQIAKDKPAQRRLKKALKELEAQEEKEKAT